MSPDAPLVVVGFVLSVVPLLAMVAYVVYRLWGIPHRQRARAAALVDAPGAFLDVLLVGFVECTLPWMALEAAGPLGATPFFGYAVVLTSGFLLRGQR